MKSNCGQKYSKKEWLSEAVGGLLLDTHQTGGNRFMIVSMTAKELETISLRGELVITP